MAFETFKIINKENTLYHDLVTLLALQYNKYNFRYINTVQIPTVKTTWYGLDSFRDFASKTWNELKYGETIVVNSSEYGMKNNCKNDSIDIFLEKNLAIN